MTFVRLGAMARKEFAQLRRDRLTFGMIVGIPMIQLLLFGYAINTDVRHIKTAIVDDDRTASSRDLARSLEASGYFDLVGYLESKREIEALVRSGAARVVVAIPSGYEASTTRGIRTKIDVVIDGSDPQLVNGALGAATGFFAARAASLVATRLGGDGELPITFEALTWYNPELRSAVFIVPGLTGLILTMTMVMFTAMALTRERERGTLEQLIVSPVKPVEIIVGKILPYIAIGYVQISIILATGHFVFGVPIIGSLLELYLLAFLYIAANLSIGMLLSTLVKTQQQAMQSAFFLFLPSVLLSGFMFPFEGMPRPAQWVGNLLPITHFLRIVRGIVLRGAEIEELVPELAALTAILSAVTALATARFRKRLD